MSSIFQSECTSVLGGTGILKKNGGGFPDSELLGAVRMEPVKPRLWMHRTRLCQQTAALCCPRDAQTQPRQSLNQSQDCFAVQKNLPAPLAYSAWLISSINVLLMWRFTPMIVIKNPWIFSLLPSDGFEGSMNPPISLCQAFFPPHHASEPSEAWSITAAKKLILINSTNQIRQPHFKSGGNTDDETLQQCFKYRFRGLAFKQVAFTSKKLSWVAAGWSLCSLELGDEKLSRRLNPFISLRLFFAETWSSLEHKKGEENSTGVKRFFEDSWNWGRVNSFCFSSSWQHLSQTHSAYISLDPSLCSVNLVCIPATCPQQICPTFTKPKESNKSVDLHPTDKKFYIFLPTDCLQLPPTF